MRAEEAVQVLDAITERDPMQALVVAVLRQAALDWQDPKHREEVLAFIESPRGALFCDFLNVGQGTILAYIRQEKRPLSTLRALKSA